MSGFFTRHLGPSAAFGSRNLLARKVPLSGDTVDGIDGGAGNFRVEDWYTGFGKYLRRRRIEILRMLLFGVQFSSALDVGCGEGLLGIVGLSNVLGIDVNRVKGATILASAEYHPFRDESFELLFAGEVIEHLNEPGRALTDWARVLKIGGRIVISTPNGALVSPIGGHPGHKHILTPGVVKESLRRLG